MKVVTNNNGHWSAQIVQERACIGTCSPKNTLTVAGVPNSIFFVWYAGFSDSPPGFEFVEVPVQVGESSDPCRPTTFAVFDGRIRIDRALYRHRVNGQGIFTEIPCRTLFRNPFVSGKQSSFQDTLKRGGKISL